MAIDQGTNTPEITNLQRAMWGESALLDYSITKEGGAELYDVGESVATDMIADLCHLLSLDEKTAGCMSNDDIRQLLERAFNHFEAEQMEEENA